jgi:hypothetical protein
VHADDTVQLAQDVTRLDGGAHSTQAGDRQLEDLLGLRQFDLGEALDEDALAGASLLESGVQLRDLRRLLAGELEVADTGGVELQVLDRLVLFEDRTDPRSL